VPPLVVADAGCGEATALRLGLTARNIPYVVSVKGATTAYPSDAEPEITPYAGTGRLPVATYRTPRSTVRELALAAGRRALRRVRWRRGSKHTPGNPDAIMTSRFLALRVRPANAALPARRRVTCPSAGCWPNGRPVRVSPPITGCRPCPLTHGCGTWSAWRRSAGGSSTTTAN
ncbi:MAG TPA: transposase, partial [Thermopolyspora sp.]